MVYKLNLQRPFSVLYIVSLLALDEAESVGEISGESSHCRRLIRVCPSGMSKLSLSATASELGNDGLTQETQTWSHTVRLAGIKLRYRTNT